MSHYDARLEALKMSLSIHAHSRNVDAVLWDAEKFFYFLTRDGRKGNENLGAEHTRLHNLGFGAPKTGPMGDANSMPPFVAAYP